ncbi:MAG: cupredoxin domain-containing protein, partial [bacterium]
FGIKEAIPAGESQTFTIDQAGAGEYTIDCHLHSAHAEGKLIVKAP